MVSSEVVENSSERPGGQSVLDVLGWFVLLGG